MPIVTAFVLALTPGAARALWPTYALLVVQYVGGGAVFGAVQVQALRQYHVRRWFWVLASGVGLGLFWTIEIGLGLLPYAAPSASGMGLWLAQLLCPGLAYAVITATALRPLLSSARSHVAP